MNQDLPHAPMFELEHPPQRVVSLLPSMTQNLIDLGAAGLLVGVTDYCPVDNLDHDQVQSLGGPKNPDIESILALKPDLVLANREENTPSTVKALEDHSIPVWVTFPRSTTESMDVLWALLGMLRLDSLASARLHALQKTLDWALTARGSGTPIKTFCPIWQDVTGDGVRWWMTFNHDTYAHDVLACCGGENVFAQRQRRYPLQADLGLSPEEPADDRDVAVEEIIEKQPQLILLPDEPYPFEALTINEVKELFSETPAVQQDRVYLVEGALLTWHGTYLAQALARLPDFFSYAQ